MATALRAALWILLGGWIGAWVLFAAVVAPTAFSVLPSGELAGRVVGPVLASLHVYGVAAGVALAAVALALGRGRVAVTAPLVLALLCAVSELGVTAAIQEVRPRAFGAVADPQAAAHFARLHQLSMLLYSAVGLGALALAVWHARADARGGTTPRKGVDFS